MGLTRFYWVLLSFTGLNWVFTGSRLVLLGFTGFSWVYRVFTGFFFTGCYWVLGVTEFS